MPEFIKDVEQIRRRAIEHLEDGAVTEAYQLEKDHSIKILNEALATEIVCVLRYMHHYFMATGVHAKAISDEFKEHADAEREHADDIAERIQQLGGKPDFNPRTLLERSVSQYVEGETLAEMIREDLIAERIVIELYSNMVRYFGEKDPTTRLMLEQILSDEEEHASDLVDLLYIVDPRTGQAEAVDPGTRPLSLHPERKGSERQQTERPRRAQPEPISARGGAAASQQARAGSQVSAPEPAHEPGTTGRPTRPRPQQLTETFPEESEEGAQMGATRAVRLTKPNRKRRVA